MSDEATGRVRVVRKDSRQRRTHGKVHLVRPLGDGLACDTAITVERWVFTSDPVTCGRCLRTVTDVTDPEAWGVKR